MLQPEHPTTPAEAAGPGATRSFADARPLAGQRALVTGASSGIGAGVARQLARAGASVAINFARGPERAQAVCDEITAAGGRAIVVQGDVSQEGDVVRFVGETVEQLGGIDILINNAGLQKDAPFHQLSLADWNTVIGVNLTGQFLCAREAVRQFLRQGVDPTRSRAAGKIVCISSVHDLIPWAGHANYAASKGGVAMLMKTMAQELAPLRIRVNSVSPGAIKTPINRSAWDTPEAERALLTLIPYGRVGDTDDIAKAAIWLASDDSDYLNGTTIYVDGGMTLYPEFARGG